MTLSELAARRPAVATMLAGGVIAPDAYILAYNAALTPGTPLRLTRDDGTVPEPVGRIVPHWSPAGLYWSEIYD